MKALVLVVVIMAPAIVQAFLAALHRLLAAVARLFFLWLRSSPEGDLGHARAVGVVCRRTHSGFPTAATLWRGHEPVWGDPPGTLRDGTASAVESLHHAKRRPAHDTSARAWRRVIREADPTTTRGACLAVCYARGIVGSVVVKSRNRVLTMRPIDHATSVA